MGDCSLTHSGCGVRDDPRLLKTLIDHEVPFVVIGGPAVERACGRIRASRTGGTGHPQGHAGGGLQAALLERHLIEPKPKCSPESLSVVVEPLHSRRRVGSSDRDGSERSP